MPQQQPSLPRSNGHDRRRNPPEGAGAQAAPAPPAVDPERVAINRYQDGWRSGKPVEDPDKLKRWGWVTAKPSEYLVCTRRGTIDARRSGQGGRVFKWPWDSVAIVPTTLQRIEFVADQITRERVGVTVTGIAVYRLAEPELACRVLNFTYGEAASEKLADTLREMFIGAARRLIANLALDECLTRRKESIASFLMAEIAPVVSGKGALDDATDRGWGVVIDTIEIQDVKILSAQVFANLQAPYRAELAARAELADLERTRQVAEQRAEVERRQVEVDQTLALRKADGAAAVALRQAELDQDKALRAIKIAEEQRRARAAAEVAALDAEAARADAAHAQAARELEQGHARKAMAQAAELELRLRQTELELELRRRDAEARARDHELDAAHQVRLAEVERSLAQARALRELVTVGLPQIASAFQQSFGTIHYTQIGEGAGPLGMVAGALQQILAIARGLGLELGERDQP
jgi:hypothetical protein